MRILILCNDFPPFNSIGAERPYSWYKYFVEEGVATTVITKNWSNSSPKCANVTSFIKPNKEVYNDGISSIIRVPHNYILPEKISNKFGLQKYSFLRKTLTFLYKFLSFHISFFDQHNSIFNEANRYLQKNEVDILITTGEPFILFKYGYKLKQKYNLKWIADYRDGWSLNHVTSISTNPLIKVLRKNEFFVEKKYMSHVDAISTVDSLLSEKLNKLFNKNVFCIYNGFWKDYDSSNEIKSLKLILTHTGTLTPGQRVEFLLDTINDLIKDNYINKEDIELRFIGLRYFELQNTRIKNHPLYSTNCILTTDRVTQEQAIQYNLESDFLLAFTEKMNQAIYAKTYNYIACKKEILVLPNDNSILGDLITSNNLGSTFDSQEELKAFIINNISKKKQGVLDTNLKDIQSVLKYTRRNQAKKLLLNITDIIDS